MSQELIPFDLTTWTLLGRPVNKLYIRCDIPDHKHAVGNHCVSNEPILSGYIRGEFLELRLRNVSGPIVIFDLATGKTQSSHNWILCLKN